MPTSKFKNLVHYVIGSHPNPQLLGATKLNKILWYSDAFAFRMRGNSISGETYVKRARGPVPRTILRAISELEQEKKLIISHRDNYGYKQKLYISLADPDVSDFSESDRAIIDQVVDIVCKNHTAASISELSHDHIWEAANEGEEIPLYATLASQRGEITPEVMAWADSVVSSLEWNH